MVLADKEGSCLPIKARSQRGCSWTILLCSMQLVSRASMPSRKLAVMIFNISLSIFFFFLDLFDFSSESLTSSVISLLQQFRTE